MKTVLITGGAGFLPSYMCDQLIEQGYRVMAVDNFLTGKKENIAHLLKNKRFTFIKHDVIKPLKIKDKIDYIIHAASPASPVDYFQYPLETMLVGSCGTYHMLEMAKSKKAVFLLTSTSEVYGDPLEHPQKESYWGHVNPIGVRSIYDEAKRYAEAMTMLYRREHKVDTKITRIFNTYGPRMNLHDGRVVPNFIYQALTSKPLTIYGDGKQTRSFCYVEDEAKGILALLFSKASGPMNIGNPKEFTILNFAKEVLRLTGSKSKLIFKPLPQDDPKQRKPDITLAKKVLKWEPTITLQQGLSRTIEWFRDKV